MPDNENIENFDEENVVEDDDMGVGSGPKKKSNIIIRILVYLAATIGAVIFIVTVVVITMRVMQNQIENKNIEIVSPELRDKRPTYEYFTAIPQVRSRTIDKLTSSVVIKVDLGYRKGNKQLGTELTERLPQLSDLVRRFISEKRVDELLPVNEDVLKKELKEMINHLLVGGRIEDIIFPVLQVIQL